jgi:glycosyltransferase involved in cell wall biosynthesis
LLSTYNGALFVDEQIESILHQSHKNFHLLIRDDGSKDETPQKLLKWQEKHPEKITLFLESNVGVIESFNKIYSHSKSPYLAFCDQDDIWHPKKLEKCLRLLQKNEQGPTLIHSDLTVVNHEKTVLDYSFWNYSYLSGEPKYATLNRLLVQNVVTGCTTLFNRPLAELAFPAPKEALMHDWWFALVAAQFGKLLAIQEPLMLYRQHANNTLGAKPFSILSAPSMQFRRVLRAARHEKKKLDQAKLFLDRYQTHLDENTIQVLTDFANIKQFPVFQRIKILFKHRFFKIGWKRNLFYLVNLLSESEL